MSETNTTSKKIATKEEAVEYIKTALISGELNMRDAVQTLGWSFPRIRSKARTIAKTLNGILTKKARSIYFVETGNMNSAASVEEPTPDEADS